jgi:hypothetical protein
MHQSGYRLYAMNMPRVETLDEARHFVLGSEGPMKGAFTLEAANPEFSAP